MAKEVLELEVKSNIGEVSKGIDKATKSVGKLADETKKVDGATKTASKGFKGMGTAIKRVGVALKAAGIGLIVALFVALREAVQRNQKAMDLLATVTSTISTTFNQVAVVLTDVVKWVTESSDRFNGLGKVLSGIVTLALAPLQLSFYRLKLGIQQVMLVWEASPLGGGDKAKIAELGESIKKTKDDILAVGAAAIDAGKDIVNNIGDAINEVGAIYEKASDGLIKISVTANYEQAGATTAAVKAARFAAAEFAKLNAEKLREAELLRQITNDETKTYEERIQANKDLKKTIEEQQKLQSDQIQKQITAAALAVQQNANDENKLALLEAQNAQLELEQTITVQLSEQKKTQVGLEKELLEAQNQLRAEGLSGLERELQDLQDAYDLKLEMARKAGEDTAAITAQYEKEKTEIIEAEAQRQKDIDKAVAAAKVDALKQGLAVIGSLMDLNAAQIEKDYDREIKLAKANGSDLEDIEEKFEAKRREQAKKMKAMKIAMAIVDTYQSAVSAYSAGLSVGGPAGLVLGPVSAGLAVAAGLANVAMIEKQPLGGGGGGSAAGGGAAGGGADTPAPQMMSGAFDISGGVAPEATKAFVVTDEMSNSQNQLANIRRRATI
mgnify:CR=1 FL=1